MILGTSEPAEADSFHDVLRGHPKTETGRLNDEGGPGANVKIVSAYVPVGTLGVAELYHAYEPIAADIRATLKPLAAVLAAALVLLWLSLFPILRRVTAALSLGVPHGWNDLSAVTPPTSVASPKPSTVPLPVRITWTIP